MKKKCKILCSAIVSLAFCAMNIYGIGISPARWTNDVREYNCNFNENKTYTLYRPSTHQYSLFTVNDIAGLTGFLTGCSASSGIEYLNDKTLLIDWESEELSSLSTITASVHIQSPLSWDCPAEPGGDVYMDNMVSHSEAAQSGSGISAIVNVVSQIALYRNYAPRTHLQNMTTEGLTATLDLQFEDKQSSWWSPYADRDCYGNPFFSYDIDWDGDGQTDQSGTSTLDEEPGPDPQYPTHFRWTSGIQMSTIELDHVFETAGMYTAMITVNDSKETTTLEIPISVVPEPGTLALLGLGGLFLRKRRIGIRKNS